MEMVPNEQNYYMQHRQQERQPTMFLPPQQQAQPYPHVNQQRQPCTQYQCQQMPMYGISYIRPSLFQSSNMSMDRNMQMGNLSGRNASLSNNMYPANTALNGMPSNGHCNEMSGWDQSLNESYNSYNHYVSGEQTHMSIAGRQNKAVSHNRFGSVENCISSGYQATLSPAKTRPVSVSANLNFSSQSSIQTSAEQQHVSMEGGIFSTQPPQYSKSLLDRLLSHGGDYSNLPNEINQNMISRRNEKQTLMVDSRKLSENLGTCNNEMDDIHSHINYAKQLKKEADSTEIDRQVKTKGSIDINENCSTFDENINVKNEEDSEGCDSTSDLPVELLPQSNSEFELMTQSLMNKSFNSFKDFDPGSPMTADLIPSICKSPVSCNGASSTSESSSSNESINEINALNSMSLTSTVASSKYESSDVSRISPPITEIVPSAMRNLYNHLVSDKEDFLSFVKHRNQASPQMGPCDGNNNVDQNCKKKELLTKNDTSFNSRQNMNKSLPTLNLEFDNDLNTFLPKCDSENTSDDQNINYCQNLFQTLNTDVKTSDFPKLESVTQKSSVTSDDNQQTGKSTTHKRRHKSDSDVLKSSNKKVRGGAGKKVSRKAPSDGVNKASKPKKDSSENKSATCVTPSTSALGKSTNSLPQPAERSAMKNLYYENKVNYKFHKYLRHLISDVRKEKSESYPFDKMQNCEKVFLKQLSNPDTDSSIFDSLKPGVENGKDIDLKNMTKRKITIYEDIPTENIYEYMEKSPMKPFRYMCPNNDKIQEPSKKLVDLLLKTK